MKYALWSLFIIYILFNGCRMEGMAICCLFLMVCLLTYCTLKAISQSMQVFIKNAFGLLFILSAIFTHFKMVEAFTYCTILTGLIIAYVIFKAIFGSKPSPQTNTNTFGQPSTTEPYTYIVTKNKNTSTTQL